MSQFYFMRTQAPTRVLFGTGHPGDPLLVEYDAPGDADRGHVQTFLDSWTTYAGGPISSFTQLAPTPRRGMRIGNLVLNDRP